MDDYLCLTVLSHSGEAEAAFKARLTTLWSGMLREKPDVFEKVYAESTRFEPHADRLARNYLIEAGAVGLVEESLQAAGVESVPIDANDLFSKYEAAPPDWFWIEH